MSRGSNVYVAVDRQSGDLLAGFSVKYEMFDWLKRMECSPEDTRLFRLRDGRGWTQDKSPIEILKWEIREDRRKGCPCPSHHPDCDCEGMGGDR